MLTGLVMYFEFLDGGVVELVEEKGDTDEFVLVDELVMLLF